jgi:hypothetical protein
MQRNCRFGRRARRVQIDSTKNSPFAHRRRRVARRQPLARRERFVSARPRPIAASADPLGRLARATPKAFGLRLVDDDPAKRRIARTGTRRRPAARAAPNDARVHRPTRAAASAAAPPADSAAILS